ncbi:hypothetical protein KAU08_05970 [bacterium]|nr:hypothetical protein [bacterium]
MRKLLFSMIAFMLMTVTAQAVPFDDGSFGYLLGPVQLFIVNNTEPLTFTFDEYSDFGVAQDIGDVNYDLVSNVGWEVTGKILDGVAGGQTVDDWDDTNWTLSVNGVAIDETVFNVIDTDPNPVNRTGALWEVLLTIPWPEAASTADCQIELTASTI